MANFYQARFRHWQHRTIGRRLPYSDSTDVPRVRRHKHEEDVAFFGDSCSHAEQSRLLLLPMAVPNAGAPAGGSLSSACIYGASMPGASARLQSLHDRTGGVRSARGARCALCAAAAVVIAKRCSPVTGVVAGQSDCTDGYAHSLQPFSTRTPKPRARHFFTGAVTIFVGIVRGKE